MAYLEQGSKFWRCDKTDPTSVSVCYGKCGTTGRVLNKTFSTVEDADAHVAKIVTAKRKAGYQDATAPTPPTADGLQGGEEVDDKIRSTTAATGTPVIAISHNAPTTPQKRKATPPSASTTAPFPSMTKGFMGLCAPNLMEHVDSGVAGVDAVLASRVKLHDTLHARLVLVDPSTNLDEFYILQVLVDDDPPEPQPPHTKKAKGRPRVSERARSPAAQPTYYVFSRWGRSGTSGQAKLDEFQGEATVEEEFSKLFHAKTGLVWSQATPGAAPEKGNYEYLNVTRQPFSDSAKWYYYLQNDPLGKKDGWYEYDASNRDEVERLYSEYKSSGSAPRLATRLVYSESSGFTYQINLAVMTQSNTSSHMKRPIGRSENGNPPVDVPTLPQDEEDDQKPPATPQKNIAGVSPSKKSTAATPVRRCGAASAATVAGKVDGAASSPLQAGSIWEDYDAMLNQTNIGAANNNKFYKLQLIDVPGDGLYLFTRWGRVGEMGATQENGPMNPAQAIKEFGKKFRSKSANKWEDRGNFVPKKGKYTLVEMEQDEETAAKAMTTATSLVGAASPDGKIIPRKVKACTLEATTRDFVNFIFDKDMFKTAMTNMNIDPTKLPLGALSKAQIKKGFSVLEEIENELKNPKGANQETLTDLSSRFYTVIPHCFGRQRGAILNSEKAVSDKYEMLNTLSDIEAAQDMQRQGHQSTEAEEESYQDHPTDLNYQQLNANLSLVHSNDDDFAILQTFLQDTQASQSWMTLRHIWRVDRHNESQRFAQHQALGHRKLLWHGTNVAVVAAILKSGLRIMPHSGGRVGMGIYLADRHEKSEWYVSSAKRTAIMFLVEAALGKEHVILMDDSSLKKAPPGYDSVLALGTSAPPEEQALTIDGNTVQVPCGKPKQVPNAKGSSFEHNEFLIYNESQHRIRYVLTFDTKH
jgi:poly [ADP-ribose] polymerase 2/3/4